MPLWLQVFWVAAWPVGITIGLVGAWMVTRGDNRNKDKGTK